MAERVRLDPDVLHADLEARYGKPKRPTRTDEAFKRFMARTLEPVGKRGGRPPRSAPGA
jgi:hypothetical protein